jgi:hypothetical protein
MQVVIEITDSDPKGKNGGTEYKITQTITGIRLPEMIGMSDDQLKAALYPADTIAYIRGQLVSGDY